MACKYLLGEDQKRLIDAAAKAVHFANKRVAHRNRKAQVATKFSDLDKAIDVVKDVTNKYLLLIYNKPHDIHQEMLRLKLPERWDQVFLETWATPETLAMRLGERLPPHNKS